jgi:GLPGLI family protein
MKILLLFIFTGCHFFCFSQQSNTNVQVEYQLFCNTNKATKLFTTLNVSNNVSIYQEKYSTAEDWEEHKIKVPEGAKIFGGTSPRDSYLKIDRNKKEIFFFDMIGGNNFLVKDNYPELEWKISSETKDISGFSCVKATTTYRGRDWVTWFTPQIPLPFGPWKLQGLPGLILEAYDTTNKYTFKPVKVEYKTSDIFDKDFKILMSTKNSAPISYQKFLQDTEEVKDNLYNRNNGNNDIIVTRIQVPREGKELKFEWEK